VDYVIFSYGVGQNERQHVGYVSSRSPDGGTDWMLNAPGGDGEGAKYAFSYCLSMSINNF